MIMKTINGTNQERILKSARGKGQVRYKVRPINITHNFSAETLKVRRACTNVLQTLKRPQMPTTVPNKTSIHHRWRKEYNSMKKQIKKK